MRPFLTQCLFSVSVLTSLTQCFAESPLDHIERKIGKEPAYKSQPRYALLVFGASPDSKVWMVEDDKTLYVDKNANGDLTDDGPPPTPANLARAKYEKGEGFQFHYGLDAIGPADGSKHTDLIVRRWNYGDPEDSYGISVTLNGKVPMYAGWFGTFWAASPRDVPLIHFGGPMQIKLLRFKELPIHAKGKRLNIGFFNLGRGKSADSRLDIFALPKDAKLTVDIDWPVEPGSTAVKTSVELAERCCYWEFFNPDFGTPDEIAPGIAHAKLSITNATFPLELVSDRFEFPVVAPSEASAH
jgi:hypothetical protein